MDTSIIPLEAAAKMLSVPVDTLLKWNEYNILKPTITNTGQVGYRQEQISQFLDIQKPQPNPVSLDPEVSKPSQSNTRSFSFASVSFVPIFAFVLSFLFTIVVSQIIMRKLLPDESQNSKTILASQISKSEPLPLKNVIDPEALNNLSTKYPTYNQITNFASETEKAEADVLATTVLGSSIIQNNNQIAQTSDKNLPLVLLTLCLLFLPSIFKKQPKLVPSNHLNNLNEQKIIELNQKADGAIVLCFQGQEYQVSKPELDSESDQFIERLLELVTPGIKEIDYDASKDDKFSLSAPLSKLVTRLGFVGIKRDLFFPRTSKNRVLFRRYLTEEDLASMNLSLSQLSSEF